MTRELPPLNALRAFEAAGRHLSFTRGAEELHVTQAAVSQQVKLLEKHLGTRLFRRLHRSLVLTEEGQLYLAAVRDALDALEAATRRLSAGEMHSLLTVSVLPSFAARWLVPRLGRFHRRHPEIDIRLAPDAKVVDFARHDADVGIRYGRGRYPGLRCDRLLEEEVFPVCSPALLAGGPPLRAPADLARHTLLHDESDDDWRTWLLAAGVEGVTVGRGPIFTDSSMLLQAAVDGQGIALARSVLAKDELAAGRLARPFGSSGSIVQPGYAYFLVCPERAAEWPRVGAFRAWLLDEIKQGG